MPLKDRLADVPVLGTALRMHERYQADAADQFAASMGFFAFLSMFPLLLIAVAVAGLVVAGDGDQQRRLVQALLDAVPGLSAALGGGTDAQPSQLATLVDTIAARAGTIGVVGGVLLLLSGLRVVNAAMLATLQVFRIELDRTGLRMKLRQLGALVLLGILALAGVAATAALGVVVRIDVRSAATVAASIGSVVLSVVLDFLLFATAYRVLAAGRGPRFSRLWPGALLAAVAWTALKALGATYVTGQVARANELYGIFGGVIGLLLLLYLAGRIYLYGAELSALLCEPGRDLARRDPRAAFTDGRRPSAAPVPHRDPDRADDGGEGGDGADGSGTAEAAAGPTGVGADTPPFPRDPEADHARIVPAAHEASPVITPDTRARLEVAEASRPRGADVRGALAFVIAVGAVGGLVRFFRPWETD